MGRRYIHTHFQTLRIDPFFLFLTLARITEYAVNALDSEVLAMLDVLCQVVSFL